MRLRSARRDWRGGQAGAEVPHLLARCAACVSAAMAQGRARAGIISQSADAKLGQCIVRSEFSEYFVTAREKRLQAAASRRKRLPLPADARANHDEAREDEHGGDGDGEAHDQTARPLFTR